LLYRIWIAFVWIFLGLFSAFRYKIGPDYLQYEIVHGWLLAQPEIALIISEPFHVFLTFLAEYMGAGFQFVAFVYSILTITIFYFGFRYFAPNRGALAIMTVLFTCMLYAASLNGIRQYLAAAIFLYSCRFIVERKLLPYLILIFISFLVHKSAVLLVPIYFLHRDWKNVQVFAILISLSLVIFAMQVSGINMAEGILQIIGLLGLDYSSYVDGGRFSASPPIYTLVVMIFSIIFVAALAIFKRDHPLMLFAFNMCVGLVCVKLIASNMTILGRFDLFFEPFVVVILALLCSNEVRARINPISREQLAVLVLITGLGFAQIQMARILSGENSYSQYSINTAIFSKTPRIIQVYGKHENVENWQF
ncbi:MAG: EpsG family protein, partial [Chloroflexota bacterium]